MAGVGKEKLINLGNKDLLDELGINLKWYPDSTKGGRANIVSYFDARDVAKILDHVLGPENWSDEYHELKGNLFCRISVKLDDGSEIYREDVGTPSTYAKEKGEASDAFKRAATKLGVRFAYETGVRQFPMQGDYIVISNNQKIHKRDTEQLSVYCNGMNTQLGLLARLWNSDTSEKSDGLKEIFAKLKDYYSEV